MCACNFSKKGLERARKLPITVSNTVLIRLNAVQGDAHHDRADCKAYTAAMEFSLSTFAQERLWAFHKLDTDDEVGKSDTSSEAGKRQML